MSTNDIVNDFINTLADKVVAQASSRLDALIAEKIAEHSTFKLNDPALLDLIDHRSNAQASEVMMTEDFDEALTKSTERLLDCSQIGSDFHDMLRDLAYRTAEQAIEREDIRGAINNALDNVDYPGIVEDALRDYDFKEEIGDVVEEVIDERLSEAEAERAQEVAKTVREVLSTATINLPSK